MEDGACCDRVSLRFRTAAGVQLLSHTFSYLNGFNEKMAGFFSILHVC